MFFFYSTYNQKLRFLIIAFALVGGYRPAIGQIEFITGGNTISNSGHEVAFTFGTITGYPIENNYYSIIFGVQQPFLIKLNAEEINNNFIVELFPNPALDNLQIRNQTQHLISNVAILNLQGEIVRSITDFNNYYESTDIRGLSSGTYIMKIRLSNNTIITHKLIKL